MGDAESKVLDEYHARDQSTRFPQNRRMYGGVRAAGCFPLIFPASYAPFRGFYGMKRALFLILLAAAVAIPVAADAQNRPRAPRGGRTPAHRANAEGQGEDPTGPLPTVSDLPTIIPRLHSANPDEVREAIDMLTIIDRPEVVAPLAELLRSGQTDAVTDRALDSLAAVAEPQSIEVLVEFTHHRRESARRRAYLALAAIHDSRVPTLIEQGLRDSDRAVRGAAALALGDIGARGSVPTLFRAFERGVLEAAIAIGKLGDSAAVTHFTESLNHQPLAVMLSGYEEFVRRADLNDQVKLRIVGSLAEVPGPMVKQFLQAYSRTFSERDHGPVRRAVEEAIRIMPDVATGTNLPVPAAAPAPAGGAQ